MSATPGVVRAATENSGVASSFGTSTSRTAQDAAVNPTSPNNERSLTLTGGASFSSPMAAGAALLVRQYFSDGFYPSGERNAARAPRGDHDGRGAGLSAQQRQHD